MKRRSHAVQRNLPRPSDVNDRVLRPPDMLPDLNSLQKVGSVMFKLDRETVLRHYVL